MKKYLKDAVTSGELVQMKGKGASGSFKPEKVMTLLYQFSVSDCQDQRRRNKIQLRQSQITQNRCCEDCEEEEVEGGVTS